MNPVFPSHLFEGEHVQSCRGESFHFPERFATRKISLISRGSWHVAASPASPLHRTGLLIWKGFQGMKVIDFHSLLSLPPSQTAIIIHSCRLVGDDAQLAHSLDYFVAADLRQEGLSEPQISLSQGAINDASQGHKAFYSPLSSRVSGLSDTLKQDCKMDDKIHKSICMWATQWCNIPQFPRRFFTYITFWMGGHIGGTRC